MLRSSLDERKDHLAEIAAMVFSEKGYNNASLHDICDAVGISKGGMYHYFKEKESILSYIINLKYRKFVEIITKRVSECQGNSYDPEVTFAQLIYTYANFIYKEKYLALIILNDRNKLTGKNKEKLHKIEQDIFRTVKNLLIKIPNINERYNSNLISFMIIAMSHWMGTWLRENGEMSQNEAISQMIEIVLYGVVDDKKDDKMIKQNILHEMINSEDWGE